MNNPFINRGGGREGRKVVWRRNAAVEISCDSYVVISRERRELRKSHAACRQDRYKHGGDGQVLPPVSVHRLWPSDRDDACSGCPRRAVFSGEKEICHCFLSQLHSSLIEHKHLLWSLPIPEPIWDVGARNIPSSWEIALASAAHLHLIDSGRQIRSVCGDHRPPPFFCSPADHPIVIGRNRKFDAWAAV